jgi:hypothetical protein
VFVPLTDEHRVAALDASNGKERWRFWAGARIDTPPTYHKDSLLFGSADGWVYCLRAEDGELIWRFRGGPCDRRIGAFGQLESVWPVHGSVLVLDDVVYFVVGRSSQLDGGMWVYGLDAATGALRYRTKLEGPDYGVEGLAQNYRLPMGALPDVLQSDGELIFMRQLVFDAKLAKANPGGANAKRVRAKGGLLDDSYFKRIPWTFGAKSAYARMIVHDPECAYFVRMFETLRGLDPNVYFVPGKVGYRFFATGRASGKIAWNRQIPVRANAMAVTSDRLLVAGAPDVVGPDDPLGAFEDRKGGLLYVCDKDSGQTVREYQLDSTPVFNGLAVASQCVFVSMQNGALVCFGD